jgi:hypothetical protein
MRYTHRVGSVDRWQPIRNGVSITHRRGDGIRQCRSASIHLRHGVIPEALDTIRRRTARYDDP